MLQRNFFPSPFRLKLLLAWVITTTTTATIKIKGEKGFFYAGVHNHKCTTTHLHHQQIKNNFLLLHASRIIPFPFEMRSGQLFCNNKKLEESFVFKHFVVFVMIASTLVRSHRSSSAGKWIVLTRVMNIDMFYTSKKMWVESTGSCQGEKSLLDIIFRRPPSSHHTHQVFLF